jgi:hypothetical protein
VKASAIIVIGGLVALGAADRANAAPAWCKDASFRGDVDASDLSSKEPEEVVVALAHATCAPTPEVEAHRAEIEAGRKAWGQRLGMEEDDWADVIAWVNADGGRAARLELSTKDVAQFTPLDQVKAISDGFPRPGGNGNYRDPIYVTDALETSLTHAGRYAFIRHCLKAEASIGSRTPPAATWALCQDDIEKLDLAKLHAELRADKGHGGDVKMALRFELRDLPKRLEQHAEAVQAALKLDPVYKQMFDAAAAGRRDWEATLGKDAKLLELAQQMDSATWSASRRQFEGCQEKTAAALEAAVAKVPASTFKDMEDERNDLYGGFAKNAGPALLAIPEVNLAAAAYVTCEPDTGTGDFLAYYLGETVGFRGPRSAGFSRMLAEKLTLDDLNARLEWPETSRPYRRSGGSMGSAGGVVASTKMDGDFVVVTLERLIVKTRECVESHRTNRISRILPDGAIEYETVCDKMGTVSRDKTWADFRIRKAYAPLLKPGVKFSSVLAKNQELGTDVIALWPNRNADSPSWLVGARVK